MPIISNASYLEVYVLRTRVLVKNNPQIGYATSSSFICDTYFSCVLPI